MKSEEILRSELNELLDYWRERIQAIDWRKIINERSPKDDRSCGDIYELLSLEERPNESVAIADMRKIEYADPHYHANGETEIYFVLHGRGTVVVGDTVYEAKEGSEIIVPPMTAHYTIPRPEKGLVLAVINTPPFDTDNYVTFDSTKSHPDIGFNVSSFVRHKSQYERAT